MTQLLHQHPSEALRLAIYFEERAAHHYRETKRLRDEQKRTQSTPASTNRLGVQWEVEEELSDDDEEDAYEEWLTQQQSDCA
jgi:hypothetical protein